VDPLNISSTPAAYLTRYYAPYALQAAASYLSTSELNRARGKSKPAPWNGSSIPSDVLFAVAAYQPTVNDQLDLRPFAARYLLPWRYEFGHEGFLACLDNPNCKTRGRRISSGPTFHVWVRYPQNQKTTCNEVSIAFRGTNVSSDWWANLRYINPLERWTDDHYRQLRRNIDAIITRIVNLPCYKRATPSPQIVSVGHSLGGGLAEFAALANNPANPRIVKVFSFNASPEVASDLIDKNTLATNAERLEIDRVYQLGEPNYYARTYFREDFPQSRLRCRPQVRNVQFGVFGDAGVLDLHKMQGLAREFVRLSRNEDKYRTPDRQDERVCPTDYKYLDTDEYQAPPPPNPSPEIARATRSAALSRHPNGSPIVQADLRTDSYESTFALSAGMHASPAKLAPRRGFQAGGTIAHRGKMLARSGGALVYSKNAGAVGRADGTNWLSASSYEFSH
jgi:hypothetical protein